MPPASSEVVSRDPWSGEVVFTCRAATEDAVAEAVERAVAGAERWSWVAVEERASALARFADLLESDAVQMADLIVREVGKLRVEAESEVAWTATSARWYADHPPPKERAGGALVARRPLGVIAAVTPWNVPLVTPAWKWLPALVAGNAVVWKPSELATASALHARRLLLEAGVPQDVLDVLPGGPAIARSLCADERVAGVHFTGSEAAGRALLLAAAPRFGRCALEMSGLNPAIVFADADLDLAARCIADCGTALAGQKCTATRRVLVEEPALEGLADRLGERFRDLRPGDPADWATTLGPLIGPAAAARARDAVAMSRAGGARVVAQSASAGNAGFPATLLTDLAADDPLRSEELFAPVMTLDSFASEEEAWTSANAHRYGLSAAVYSRDGERLASAGGRLQAGVVALNRRGDDVELEAPFAGFKRSGNGFPEGGHWAYSAVTNLQAVYG
jgi:acyl-CoA reductase-like NAD-dependent aldehyde dehydrogenase